ncbi:mitochondrial zinc maintenance protein 1- mitochondrial [Apiospora phragmitis]|uniref:Mitochondrial zinc maintenance protein 1, mitochondrial n=1 Tax=Apiospora phragmitis TaxID=2905665 RepID=A0ABR1VRW5_9PEZI
MAAIAAYRNLWRSARIAFQGDQPILEAAQNQIRTGFRNQAHLKPSDPKFAEEIRHAEDVATILKQNVVQGKEKATLTLRIHEHVERGDNDTVKVAGGKTVKVTPGKTCSSN